MPPLSSCTLLARKFVLSFFLIFSCVQALSDNDSCARYRVFLKRVSDQSGPKISTLCQVKNRELFFSLMIPEGADLTRSTLFEISGKGESWRTYNLGKKSDIGNLGEFVFEIQGKEYLYRLEYLPLQKKIDPNLVAKKEQRLMVGASYGSFSVTQPEFEAKESKPGLILKALHFPLWGSFGLFALLDLPLSISQSEKTISFTQVELGTSFELPLSDGFRIRLRGGFGNFNFVHDLTNIGMSGPAGLAGVGFDLALSDDFWIYLDGSSLGFLGSGLKKQSIVDLGFRIRTQGLLGYGAGARLQSFEGLNTDGQVRSLSQLSFQAFLMF